MGRSETCVPRGAGGPRRPVGRDDPAIGPGDGDTAEAGAAFGRQAPQLLQQQIGAAVAARQVRRRGRAPGFSQRAHLNPESSTGQQTGVLRRRAFIRVFSESLYLASKVTPGVQPGDIKGRSAAKLDARTLPNGGGYSS